MKHFKSMWLIVLLSVFSSFMAHAQQQIPQLPIDTAVRIGQLPNGMTYYIRHNNLPEKQAFFYIVQKVGSVQEDESQRGLAHFLEHMAFNGSQNFPDSSLVNYCESIGVRFGRDLNAYTSTDETVYNIDNVPVTPANIDSCLLILHDWSHYLDLKGPEIDKERGVIHEEWRLRSSAMQRILERNLEKLYPGSKYGRRMPIGLMSIVDGCPYDTLRAYYQKWYHPNLQGIIVAGDINVDQIEAKVKQIFSSIPNPENQAKYEDYPVPDNDAPIYVIDKDKEQQQNVILAYFKQDVMPRAYRNTQAYLMKNYFESIATGAFNARMSEIAQDPNCPFMQAGISYGQYIISKTKDAANLFIVPKPGKDLEATKLVMSEVERAKKYGFNESELLRINEENMSALESVYKNRNKRRTSAYIQSYVSNFLKGTPVLSISDRYQIMTQLNNVIKMQKALKPACDEIFKTLCPGVKKNFVMMALYPEKEDVKLPTIAQMQAAVEEGFTAPVTPYVDNVKNEPLISKLPKAGKVVKTQPADFGYTKWTLSNGVVVYSKHTDFNESSVSLYGRSWGGSNLFNYKDPKTLLNIHLLGLMDNLGLGNFTSTELDKALAGKQVALSTNVGWNAETISGNSTPKDLRTLFELLYLKFTQSGNDAQAFSNYVTMMKAQLENISKIPEQAFSDSLKNTLYNRDIRMQQITKEDLNMADFKLVKKMYDERFGAVNDFAFFITGNYDTDSLRTYLEEYVAALPKGKVEKKAPSNLNFVKGKVTNRFLRKMETPKGNIQMVMHGDFPYTQHNDYLATAFGEILSTRLLKSIREDKGYAYSVSAQGDADYGFKEQFTVLINCPVQPAHADEALSLMNKAITEIAEQGVTAEELDKVKKFELKSFDEAQKRNAYWQSLIVKKVMWNLDQRSQAKANIESITPKEVQKFAQDVIMKNKNVVTVVMLPEDLKEK